MKHLEEYYNQSYNSPNDRPFPDLSDREKAMIADTYGFAVFKLQKEVEQLGDRIYNFLPSWVREIIKP